jgi:glucokinase
VDGSIYRGNNHHAGEIACMVPGVEFLGNACDRFGPLGNLILKTAARGKETLAEGSGAGAGLRNGQIGVAETFQAARRGEGWATEIMEKLFDYIGLIVTNIVALLDPEMVILGGELAPASDLFIEPIIRAGWRRSSRAFRAS